MCLTPKISLLTAATEFVVACFIFFKYKRTKVIKLVALFVFLLGFYQFTEFMLCKTGNVQFWGVAGFITYTFLPPVGFSFVLALANRKSKNFLIYFSPVVLSAIAIASDNFVTGGGCSRYFLTIKTLFTSFGENFVFAMFYLIYYFGYISLTLILLAKEFKRDRNPAKRRIYLLYIFGTIVSLFPALFLIIILPSLNVMFPSIYCQFALLFSVVAIFAANLDSKRT